MTVVEDLKDFLFEGDLQERYLIKYSAIPLSTIAFYVVFVKWWGPYLMKDRKPFDLKYIMIVYNFLQCFGNAFILYEVVLFVMKYWYGRCLVSQHPDQQMAIQDGKKLAWLIFLIKYTDLLDTVFFVLRKKDNQVTFLHIFHHTVMCILCWWFIRALNTIGFYVVVGVMINTAVHVIMYFYYGLAAFGPDIQKFLWWKRHLTQLQIFQFFVIMVYMLHGFVTGCEVLGPVEIITFLYVLIVCFLFFDFYKKDKQKAQTSIKIENNIEQWRKVN